MYKEDSSRKLKSGNWVTHVPTRVLILITDRICDVDKTIFYSILDSVVIRILLFRKILTISLVSFLVIAALKTRSATVFSV